MGRVLALVAAIILSGCASKKELVATGGSRSDGTVVLSYEHSPLERPQLDAAQGLVTARQRCAAWGYSDAEAFGGVTRQCQSPTYDGGCYRWFVSMTYQCLGAGKPT